MVRIFVKRDSTNWGYDSTSKSSDYFCRTVVVVTSGPLRIKFKIDLVEGHPLFFEHRFSRCESYTCREYKYIVFYDFLQKNPTGGTVYACRNNMEYARMFLFSRLSFVDFPPSFFCPAGYVRMYIY